MKRKTLEVTISRNNKEDLLKEIERIIDKYGVDVDIEISRLGVLDHFMIDVKK